MRQAPRARPRVPLVTLVVTLLLAPALAGCVDDSGPGDEGGARAEARFALARTLDVGGVAQVGRFGAPNALAVVVAGDAGTWWVPVTRDASLVGEPRAMRASGAVDVAVADFVDWPEGNATEVAFLDRSGAVAIEQVDEAGAGAKSTGMSRFPAPAHALAPVDPDNDGVLDVAVATEEGFVIAWGTAAGVLDGNRTRVTTTPVHAFTFIFANDDLLFDVLLAEPDGVKLLVNDDQANGTFIPAPEHAVPPVPGTVRSLVPLDYDNDQRVDALLATDDGLVLLENAGRARYREVTKEVGLPVTGAWRSAVSFDADNDGWMDVLALDDAGRLRYYRNEEGARFVEQAAAEDAGVDARALAVADLNGDGRVDVLALGPERTAAYRNAAPAGHFLSIDLEARESAWDGVGAKLTLSTSTFIMLRESGGGGSPGAARNPDVHFGLGAEPARKYALAILWPSGTLQFDETDSLELLDRHVVAVESAQDAPWEGC